MEKNKNFIYGIATVKSGDLLIGWIEKGCGRGSRAGSGCPGIDTATEKRSDFSDVQYHPDGL